MDEVITINNNNYISYDLLCNVGSVEGHGNILFLKEIYPDMPVIKNGAYNVASFSIDEDIFLEKDHLENEAIWIKVNSKIEEDILKSLYQNEGILSQEHFLKAQDELIERELNSKYTSFYYLLEDGPEDMKISFLKAMDLTHKTFPWTELFEKTLQDPEHFSISAIRGSSEINLFIDFDDKEKAIFYKNVSDYAEKRIEEYENNIRKHFSKRSLK